MIKTFRAFRGYLHDISKYHSRLGTLNLMTPYD